MLQPPALAFDPMRITTWAEYGLICSLNLARRYGNGPVTGREIATQERLPADYVEQILLRMRRAGIVTSVRGAHGGYVLARHPRRHLDSPGRGGVGAHHVRRALPDASGRRGSVCRFVQLQHPTGVDDAPAADRRRAGERPPRLTSCRTNRPFALGSDSRFFTPDERPRGVAFREVESRRAAQSGGRVLHPECLGRAGRAKTSAGWRRSLVTATLDRARWELRYARRVVRAAGR